ncbi:hypothetical protein D6T64_21575 [Cryobacterium melibiosiphilum]|uniref:Uncharacterized protein n=1 Tax=Cryobacterium melibiosiphilum TaxID=995039 RepID=A0A3A5M7P7_9MICO|nr:hypothetical protein [Cryobacterium melibiosiphilum]RJT84738.1 hypothetical protein D6T64_21575 [Cryobacterium melibiosiphilum]
MNQVRVRAAAVRADATELRARASSLLQQSGAMGWNSKAGDALRERITEVATSLGGQAQALDDAATALEAHAHSVDDVKQAIRDAQLWVEDRWREAQTVAATAVETVQDVADAAVTRFMRVMVDTAANLQTGMVRIAVFTVAGVQVTAAAVDHAHEVITTIPVLPVGERREWLDVRSTYAARGWV